MQFLELKVIIILELMVGLIVFLGGAALTFLATDKVLGIIHVVLGLFAFPVAYGLWKRDSWAWIAALFLNLASILYSTFSEIIVVNGTLLPPGALQGSIGGTIAAVIMSITIIVLLARERTQFKRPRT
ncbi:MAG TPA: hypothetical protein VGS11_12135 [Candidatus Bathyarchaeia archaeon]|nr:hypothetical protein [Candidatus Bathyarchaeia archaeon]